MRVLVTGSRDWALLPEAAEAVVLRMMMVKAAADRLTIVHGGCPTGIDAAFDAAARRLGVDVEVHEADWDDLGHPDAVIRRDGRGRPYDANAGPRRNQRMVDLGADLCVGFARDLRSSRGTRDCLARAVRAGIPTYLCDSEDARPRRVEAADLGA